MDPEQQSPVAGTPIFQDTQDGKNAKWLWILIALIVIGALAFAFFRGIGPFSRFRGGSEAQVSPSPEAVFEEASPTPEATPEASVDKASAKIRILNGGGKAGAASEAKDFLESRGWEVSSLGNAESFDFTQTVVRVKEKFKALGSALVEDLSSKYSVQSTIEELEATGSADIEVIVGSK